MKKYYETIDLEVIDFEELGIVTDGGDHFDFNSGEGDDGDIGEWD